MYIRPISTPVTSNVSSSNTVLPHGKEDALSGFSGALQKAASTLKNLDQEALAAQLDLISGNARDMHTAVLAVEKASLALNLVVSVRNKALEAYQEIMRMPV